ncbi:hypothetical protein [Hanamia caeni]|jgi:hypothetical protein|uniref:hypothetical protein n=1 Tax=Hanamia caeni TaxID=2294116 RepID=UPI0013144411|nr:hypothetical protein [Hanamia caeni]
MKLSSQFLENSFCKEGILYLLSIFLIGGQKQIRKDVLISPYSQIKKAFTNITS